VTNKRFLSLLKQLEVTSAEITDGRITVYLFGKAIEPSHRIRIVESLPSVGKVFKSKPVVRLDNDLVAEEKYKRLCAVHEVLERYFSNSFGPLTPFKVTKWQAHKLAEHLEKKYAKKINVNWTKYTSRVNDIYEKENA